MRVTHYTKSAEGVLDNEAAAGAKSGLGAEDIPFGGGVFFICIRVLHTGWRGQIC